jgi:hypothetical protein
MVHPFSTPAGGSIDRAQRASVTLGMALQTPKLSPVDVDLGNFEQDIRIFKIEFEQYFGGGRPRPPADVEWRIEQMIKRYGERPAEVNSAQRFRYNNLAQTFTKFREMFKKRLKQREEGIVPRHFGPAARAIEAERARKEGRSRDRGAGKRQPQNTVLFTDPEHELREVERLYQVLQKVREEAGDKSQALERDQFLDIVRRKTEELRKGRPECKVEYSVVLEAGKPRMKARVKK